MKIFTQESFAKEVLNGIDARMKVNASAENLARLDKMQLVKDSLKEAAYLFESIGEKDKSQKILKAFDDVNKSIKDKEVKTYFEILSLEDNVDKINKTNIKSIYSDELNKKVSELGDLEKLKTNANTDTYDKVSELNKMAEAILLITQEPDGENMWDQFGFFGREDDDFSANDGEEENEQQVNEDEEEDDSSWEEE